MFDQLPADGIAFSAWTWPQIEPYFNDLASRDLNERTVETWLSDWSRIAELVSEGEQRLYVASTLNTTDPQIEARYHAYLADIIEPYEAASQTLREKLLSSGLQPAGYDVPLKQMRTEAELFREANLPLLTDEKKLAHEYNQIRGAQTVQWEGEERTIDQMGPVFLDSDREVRERAWRLVTERQLADREAINTLWSRFMTLRGEIAGNADQADYRAYQWREYKRFDYTPEDCLRFHDAIEAVVVPAATRIYERRRQRMGIDSVRPWDLNVDPLNRAPLKPYTEIEQLVEGSSAIFHRLDPQLGEYFEIMRRENLLDLVNRKGKAPGGYCTEFAAVKRPFIFMNAVGIHDDVQTMLHEAGHAFHGFESAALPYFHQRSEFAIPTEFAEVASMSMEMLGGPYLSDVGGFYNDADAARARIEYLEGAILFWPYMAVVDALQHWIYTHHQEATDPANVDAKWAELWGRFMKGEDWSGLDDAMVTGWHRKLHIHEVPFYYVEYGLAQLGAFQVWRNSLHNERDAVAAYRAALGLGNTKPLPDLFAAAGAKFQPDAATLRECVELAEATIEALDRV